MLSSGSKIKNIEIESFIGEGGMGLVFKGKDIKLARTVAVKALRSDFSRNDEMLRRFQGEGKIQAKLGKHKNIVPIYDFFEEDENHYLIMEYIEGETLQEKIDKVGLIPPDRGLAIFKGILSAVAHAHSKNIIHRDLKPSNVLINSKDKAKVMDFGIAKEEGTRGFTQTGGLVGSFHYMAPELFRGNTASKESDVWSLGVTLFEILTGHLPFKGKRDDVMSLILNISRDQAPSAQKYYPYIPDKIESAIKSALEKDPLRRTKSAEEFFSTLKGTRIKPPLDAQMVKKIKRVAMGAEGVAACASCSSENSLASTFCGTCGGSLISPCPKCGEDSVTTAAFCTQCGVDKVKHDEYQALVKEADKELKRHEFDAARAILADANALAPEWDEAEKMLAKLAKSEAKRRKSIVESFISKAENMAQKGKWKELIEHLESNKPSFLNKYPGQAQTAKKLHKRAHFEIDNIKKLEEGIEKQYAAGDWGAVLDFSLQFKHVRPGKESKVNEVRVAYKKVIHFINRLNSFLPEKEWDMILKEKEREPTELKKFTKEYIDAQKLYTLAEEEIAKREKFIQTFDTLYEGKKWRKLSKHTKSYINIRTQRIPGWATDFIIEANLEETQKSKLKKANRRIRIQNIIACAVIIFLFFLPSIIGNIRVSMKLGDAEEFLNSGEYELALEAVEEARTIDPSYSEIGTKENRVNELRAIDLLNEAEILISKGEYDLALERLEKAMAIGSGSSLVVSKVKAIFTAIPSVPSNVFIRFVSELQTLTGHGNLVRSVAFSPDGNTLVSGSSDQTIKLWRVRDGRLMKTITGHGNWVRSVAFSPDGKTLASGSGDKSIKLWRVSDGRLIKTFTGHGNYVRSVAFSPDGNTLASGSSDQTIKLWRVRDGRLMKTITGHGNWVRSVAFSPDGNTLASGSYDNTIKLWRVSDGKLMKTLTGHGSYVWSVAFSPDGKTLASGSEDNTIKLWGVE
jgi:tetratricopeptide (TPR) repeat protein